jgi:hypothetical protein
LRVDARLQPLQPFGLEAGIGLGDVVADPERPVQFVEARRAGKPV